MGQITTPTQVWPLSPPFPLPHQPVALITPFPAGFVYRPQPGPSLGPCSGSVCVFPPEGPSAGWGGHYFGGPNTQDPPSHHPPFLQPWPDVQQRAAWPIPESPRSSQPPSVQTAGLALGVPLRGWGGPAMQVGGGGQASPGPV